MGRLGFALDMQNGKLVLHLELEAAERHNAINYSDDASRVHTQILATARLVLATG